MKFYWKQSLTVLLFLGFHNAWSQYSCVVNSITDADNYPSVTQTAINDVWNSFALDDDVVSLKEAAYLMSTDQCLTNTIAFDPLLDGQTITVANRAVLLESVSSNANTTKILDASNVPNLTIEGPGGASASYSSNSIISVSGDNWTVIGINVANSNQHGLYAESVSNLVIQNSTFFNNALDQSVGVEWVGLPIEGDRYQEYGSTSGVQYMQYAGVRISSSTDFLVENVISSGNNGHGIFVENATDDDDGDGYSGILRGNSIGLSIDSSSAEGNFGDGILVVSSTNVLIDGNLSVANGNVSAWDGFTDDELATDADAALNTRNWYGAGIELQLGSGHTVINNILGVNPSATSIVSTSGDSLGNHKHGIYVRGSQDNVIGGVGQGNIIGGNGFQFQNIHTIDSDPTVDSYIFGKGHGIQLHDNLSTVRNNIVQGNYIGYYDGFCLPNRQDGVSILGFESSSINNLIGGSETGEGNIIAGSEYGIFSQGSVARFNTFQGNFIGTDDVSSSDIGCPVGSDAIKFQSGANNNTVGGTGEGEGNYISNTPGAAIALEGSNVNENEIVGNTMSCNSVGIDLVDGGNDDFGESPRLAVNTATMTSTYIEIFTPNADDEIDVYLVDDCDLASATCQAGGDADSAQGYLFLGTLSAVENVLYENTTDNDGNLVVPEEGYYELDLSSAEAVAIGADALTTAQLIFASRDTDDNTSEFHQCVNVPVCLEPLAVNNSESVFELCEGEEAEVQGEIVRSISDFSDETDLRYSLYSIEPFEIIETNETGEFTLSETGLYIIEGYNQTRPDECDLFSEDTISVEIQNVELASFTSVDPLCDGDQNIIVEISDRGSSTFDWVVPSGLAYTDNGSSIEIDEVTESFTITVTETTAAPFSCLQEEVSIDIVVNELPSNFDITGIDLNGICDGDTAQFSSPNISTYTYNWSSASGDSILDPTSASSISVVPTGTGTREISLFVEANGCSSEIIDTSFFVDEIPEVPSLDIGDASFCLNEEAVLRILEPNELSTYSWTISSVATTNQSLSGVNKDTLIVSMSGVSGDILVVETTEIGCASDQASIPVIIQDVELAEFAALPEYCDGDENIIVEISDRGSSYFEWIVPGDIEFSDNGSSITLNEVTESITISVIETTASPFSCEQQTVSIDLVVNSIPTDFEISGEDLSGICEGELATFSSSNISTYQYFWSSPSGDYLGSSNSFSTTVTPNGTGEREIALYVVENGCVSETIDTTFIVEATPSAPNLQVSSDPYCEGETITLDLVSPNSLSTYTWSIFSGTTTDESLSGVGKSTLTFTLGENGGEVTVIETTVIGCESPAASGDVEVSKLLDPYNIISSYDGEICSGQSIDSLATYNLTWENATSIEFYTIPSISIEQSGTGDSKEANVVFPALNEGQVVQVVALAEVENCDLDSLIWEVTVKESDTIVASFDNRDFCEELSSILTGTLNIDLDPAGTFDWYIDGSYVASGNEYNMLAIDDQEVIVKYSPAPSMCPSNLSELSDTIAINAWDIPADDGLVNGEDELLTSNLSRPVDLSADLLIDGESDVQDYYYIFSYILEEDTIYLADGVFPDGLSVTAQDLLIPSLPLGTQELPYLVETYVITENDTLCPAEDLFLISIEYAIDPPNFLCHEAESSEECPTWVVDNSGQFLDNTFQIYNRWGSLVYEGSGSEITWDGTNMNGDDLPTGTYFYIIELNDVEGQTYSGSLSIIK